MIGYWTQFGAGAPPLDGELISYVRWAVDPATVSDAGSSIEVVLATHRSGMLHHADGNVLPVQFGCWWTSLPPGNQKA